MIFGNVDAGLVGVQPPDNSQLLKSAVPDIQKLKASAWGLPELDDIAPPTLTPEKDVDTDWSQGIDSYYKLGESLANNALKLRQVGIDVTKPSPFVKNSLEASNLWHQQYNDWLEMGKRLKQSQANKKQIELAAKSKDIISLPSTGQEVTNVKDYLLDTADRQLEDVIKNYSSSKNQAIYGKENYETVAQNYMKAVETVDKTYDALKKQHPEASDILDQKRDEALSSLSPPLYNQKFADQLALQQSKLGEQSRHNKVMEGLGQERNNISTYKAQYGYDPVGLHDWAEAVQRKDPDALNKFRQLELPSIYSLPNGTGYTPAKVEQVTVVDGGNVGADGITIDGNAPDPDLQYAQIKFNLALKKDDSGKEIKVVYIPLDGSQETADQLAESGFAESYTSKLTKKKITPYSSDYVHEKSGTGESSKTTTSKKTKIDW